MKVLFIATVTRHIKSFHLPFLKWFKENGYEVHVASNGILRLENCDVFHQIDFARNPLSLQNIKSYFELKKIINENKYKIVHCHTPVGGVIGRLASIKQRKYGMKTIYTAHGFHFYKGSSIKMWVLFYPVEKILSYLTDTLITINHEDYYIAKRFNAKKTYFVNGVGVDIKRYHPKEIKEQPSKRNLTKILSVGELSKRKNHIVVLKALSKIKSQNFVYYICGEGKLIDYLHNEIKLLGLQNKVELLGYRDDIPQLLNEADIFIFPSFQEGLPVALMEAMSSKKRIIASKIRGNTDLIKHEWSGLLFDPKNDKELANLINEMLNSDDIYSQNAYETMNNYSLESVIFQMEKIYKRTIDG